jgi:hypothetical protein
LGLNSSTRQRPPIEGSWDVWPALRDEICRRDGSADISWIPTPSPGDADGWIVLDPQNTIWTLTDRDAYGSASEALAHATRLAARHGGIARAWGTFTPDEDH